MISSQLETDRFNEPQEFKNSFKWSLIIHILAALVFGVRAAFFQAEAIDYSAAVRVDLVALPDKVTSEEVTKEFQDEKTAVPQKKPDKVALDQPKPDPSKPDSINLEKVKSKQKEALEKLKKMSAIDKIKTELEKESAEKTSSKKPMPFRSTKNSARSLSWRD
jgi:hypothetical protein